MKGVIYTNIKDQNKIGMIKYCNACGQYSLVQKETEYICPCGCNGTLVWAGEKDNRIYFTECSINDLHKMGYLVLVNGDTIEYEDGETGVLHELQIYDFSGDMIECVELDGTKVVSEWQIPTYAYVSQLKSIGALDAYSQVIEEA